MRVLSRPSTVFVLFFNVKVYSGLLCIFFFQGGQWPEGGGSQKALPSFWGDMQVMGAPQVFGKKGEWGQSHIPVWLLSAWVRRGLTAPMGVPKMWVEGRLKVEPARENT